MAKTGATAAEIASALSSHKFDTSTYISLKPISKIVAVADKHAKSASDRPKKKTKG